MRYNSPLRYPGGKAKLTSVLKAIFRANNLLDGFYAEPYAGGAGLALALLFEEYASEIYLNDIDSGVYAFWHAVLYETEALCRLVRDKRATLQEWERQRQIYTHAETESPLALGFATFFLNRTNRSGIIDSARMIGGRDQNGRWKIDARYNQTALVDRIARIARYRDRIHLSRLDAADFLVRIAASLPPRSLAYLDPPYYVKGRRRLYANHYEQEDHTKIAELLPALPVHWLVSYDDMPAIRHLYRGYRKATYNLRYTASEQHHGTEVMFFSLNLVIPPNRKRDVQGNQQFRGRNATNATSDR